MKVWSWWRGMWEMRAWLWLLSKSYLLEGGVWREVDILEVGVLIVAAQRSLLLACRLKLVQCVRLLRILFPRFHPDFLIPLQNLKPSSSYCRPACLCFFGQLGYQLKTNQFVYVLKGALWSTCNKRVREGTATPSSSSPIADTRWLLILEERIDGNNVSKYCNNLIQLSRMLKLAG